MKALEICARLCIAARSEKRRLTCQDESFASDRAPENKETTYIPRDTCSGSTRECAIQLKARGGEQREIAPTNVGNVQGGRVWTGSRDMRDVRNYGSERNPVLELERLRTEYTHL